MELGLESTGPWMAPHQIANNVSLGEMAYCLGVTVSRKTLNIQGSIVSGGLCLRHGAARA